MRRLFILILLSGIGFTISAQQVQPVERLDKRPVQKSQKVVATDEIMMMDVSALTDEQLDTIDVKKKLVINDYTMFGVQYGVGLSQVMWNPTQKQEMVFIPYNIGVTFTTYQKIFNFGQKTKIDLPGEESCENLIYKAEDMKPADLATNSFGQNFNVTMTQLCATFCSLINGG